MKRAWLLPLLAILIASACAAQAGELTKIRMSINEPLIPALTEALGHFRQEGLQIIIVKVSDVSSESYLMQEPLVNGRLDASYHWFQHVVFGARHRLPLRAVIAINDAPGMKVLVANRVKDQIRSAADFKGRRIAEGAGYATKSVLVDYMARRAGLPRGSYEPVMVESEGRQQAVIAGLRENRVDVMAFMEPMTAALEATGLTTTLYDLTTRAGTVQALGDAWPAHTVFLSDDFIAKNPQVVQRLVNAFVRTMRFVNSHDAQEIAARLPPSYFGDRDRDREVQRIARFLPTLTRDNYALSPSAVALTVDVLRQSRFDDSAEGRFRASGEQAINPEDLYVNRFVEQAMREIR